MTRPLDYHAPFLLAAKSKAVVRLSTSDYTKLFVAFGRQRHGSLLEPLILTGQQLDCLLMSPIPAFRTLFAYRAHSAIQAAAFIRSLSSREYVLQEMRDAVEAYRALRPESPVGCAASWEEHSLDWDTVSA